MNMYSILETKKADLTTQEIENSFASNICRCTGYRPIADALKTFAKDADRELLDKLSDIEDLGNKALRLKCTEEQRNVCSDNKSCAFTNKDLNSKTLDDWCFLDDIATKMIVIDCGDHTWYKCYTLSDVFSVIEKSTDYKLIAGNTGQGVYHVLDYPKLVIDISNVTDIREYVVDVNLTLGAGMTLTEMMELFLKLSDDNVDFNYLKEFHDHMDLVAHLPVRNIGTIGGNLYLKHCNKEFQSDLFLLFETVGAMITIAEKMDKISTMYLTDFLETEMKGKIIINVMLPPLSSSTKIKTYKIMPRSQNAHAIVNAGFLWKFKQNSSILEKATIVYGGISPNFIHASKTESILSNTDPFSDETIQEALKTLYDEVKPENSPTEPSASYRRMLAVSLYYKALISQCPDDRINPKYKSGGNVIKRNTSKGTQTFETDENLWPLNQPVMKLEALAQCSGEATFANDLKGESDEVYAAFVTADVKPGSIISGFDTTEAFKIAGVSGFYTAQDIPGNNSFTPTNAPLILVNEEILCSKQVKYYGEPAAIIVADREKTAIKAAKLISIKYESINKNKPVLTIDDALKSPDKDTRITKNNVIYPVEVGHDVKCIIYGELNIETQHHFYMEPQTCVAKKTEDGLEIYSSTQWLDLANMAVAQCLSVPINSVNVIIRRVGGSYGGKITRSSQIACGAALITHLTGKTCRFILPLQQNMGIIGKRLPTKCNFEVGVDNNGEIQYLKNIFYQDNGCAPNETISPVTAAHFVGNCYDSRRWYVEANSAATDSPSNTWCRAPSSTEAIAMCEYIMEKVAYHLNKDPLEVRLTNMMQVTNPIPQLIDQLKRDSDYDQRIIDVQNYNKQNRWRKRALKLLPMTYDVFYFGSYNSVVSVYHADGSVVIIHGGVEMGQGLNTKVAQVCAYIFGIPLNKISVKPSTSFTSPNAMTTGGSIGSECVSFATMKACQIIMDRLKPIKEELNDPKWEDIIKKAFNNDIDLQASYMYSNKDGLKPYDVYGVVVMEVEVDILTGNHDVLRVDLLEDTGRSMSPGIDVGQIEGAFIMGLGYWTSEKVIYDQETGKLLTDRTWTYKPPGLKDIPADFRIYFRRNSNNPTGVLQSKATGEPAFSLAAVITHAIRDAVRAARLDAAYEDQWIDIPNPCTVENIFMAVGHRLDQFVLK
uniref:Indole-3-acetaldehyde oxidase n=1 Tax=Bombyx mori TaxID=7091 RepID=A0A8R2M489_BOMMO|nr:aldehyde oxidase 2 isoform X1 [Bombyx mori]